MRLRLGLVRLVLAGSTISGFAAAAGPPDAERLKIAAEEFDAGRRAFKVKDFENSAVHFENADRDAPSPEALQSAMRARKEAGQIARSATLGAWGLTRYPADKTFGDYARQVLTEADKTLHRVAISCQPDCSVIVDNKVMPFPESPSSTVYLDPGPHTIVAGWPNNRHRNSDVNAVPAGNSKLAFNAASADKPAGEPPSGSHDPASPNTEPQADHPPEGEKKSGLPPMVFFIGLATTAVLGGVTTWSGIDTLNNPGTDAIDKCKVTPGCKPDPLIEEGISHERRTNILLGVTSVVAVTTGVVALFFTNWGDDSPPAEKKEARILPVLGLSNGVTIGAVGRF